MKRGYSKDTLKFIVIAAVLMIVIKLFVLDDPKPPHVAPEPVIEQATPDIQEQSFNDVIHKTVFPEPLTEIPATLQRDIAKPISKPAQPIEPITNKRDIPAGERSKIVIIIDDMGVAAKGTREIKALPGPLTLAFLPYAPNLNSQTKDALQRGHELMIHVPMEPMNPDLDMGGIALRSDMSAAEIARELEDKIFTAFEGYQGINNHMGSRLTQDPTKMRAVMNQLKNRGLYFIDSRTISSSVAGRVAADTGIAHATRDVFLDHYPDIEAVRDALQQLERIARVNGVAVAIGHPKSHTVQGLKEWLPTLEARGFELVPASAIVQRPVALNDIVPAAGEYPKAPLPVGAMSLPEGFSTIYGF